MNERDESSYADTAYLIETFKKLFPKASSVAVDHDFDDPTHEDRINVSVFTANDVIGYSAIIGSDDDEYVFIPDSPWADTHPTLIIPLMPEA